MGGEADPGRAGGKGCEDAGWGPGTGFSPRGLPEAEENPTGDPGGLGAGGGGGARGWNADSPTGSVASPPDGPVSPAECALLLAEVAPRVGDTGLGKPRSIGRPPVPSAGALSGKPPTPGNSTYPPYINGDVAPVIKRGPGVGAIRESILNGLNPGVLCIVLTSHCTEAFAFYCTTLDSFLSCLRTSKSSLVPGTHLSRKLHKLFLLSWCWSFKVTLSSQNLRRFSLQCFVCLLLSLLSSLCTTFSGSYSMFSLNLMQSCSSPKEGKKECSHLCPPLLKIFWPFRFCSQSGWQWVHQSLSCCCCPFHSLNKGPEPPLGML